VFFTPKRRKKDPPKRSPRLRPLRKFPRISYLLLVVKVFQFPRTPPQNRHFFHFLPPKLTFFTFHPFFHFSPSFSLFDPHEKGDPLPEQETHSCVCMYIYIYMSLKSRSTISGQGSQKMTCVLGSGKLKKT